MARFIVLDDLLANRDRLIAAVVIDEGAIELHFDDDSVFEYHGDLNIWQIRDLLNGKED